MTWLAVDPGKVSGICYYDREGQVHFSEHQFDEALDYVEERIADCQTLVVERYIIMPKGPHAPWSLEMIGALRRIANQAKVPMVLQAGSDAKKFADNDRLRRMGWYARGKDHARDATRHLILFLAEHHPAYLPKEIPMCVCTPRERIPNGEDPTRCYRCSQPIPTR